MGYYYYYKGKQHYTTSSFVSPVKTAPSSFNTNPAFEKDLITLLGRVNCCPHVWGDIDDIWNNIDTIWGQL